VRHLPAGHCGGCGDPFETCTCDAMGIPAPKVSTPPLADVLTAERDKAIDLLLTLGERVLAERRTREDVRNARTGAIRAALGRHPHDMDAEPALAAAEVQHAKALAALNECLVHMGLLDLSVTTRMEALQINGNQ